ncbi:MAG TPA: HAD-IA family hydrolase [Streptosporangiaceae bacterium]|nr:HAD-IA family hydrolase [Streptosporangiaceae bacterium]
MPSIRAVVLDMDGLLIDTEPVWRTAAREVLAGLGIDLTAADLLDTTGIRVDEMVAAFLTRHPHPAPPVPPALPAPPAPPVPPAPSAPSAPPVPPPVPPALSVPSAPSPAEVADAITDLVIAHVGRAGEPMPGVPEAIALFRRSGLRLAIASSSPLRLIDAVCARLDLDIQVRCTALDEAHGKPAPDVYLAAARRLGLSPARCLAVEDSPAGVLAAKAAGMTCLAVPDPLLAGDPRYRRADLVLPSLTELDEQALCPLTT